MTLRLPDLRLLHAFGNEEVFLEKAAGTGALAARIAVGLMEANHSLNTRRREEMLSAQAERMNRAFRMVEDQKMLPVRESSRHTRMPMVLMALQSAHGNDGMGLGAPLQGVPRQLMGEDVPLGMDEGMVRMASAIGEELAHHALEKDAGVGQIIGDLAKKMKPVGQSLAKGVGTAAQGVRQAASGAVAGMKNKLQGALPGAGAGAKNPFLTPPPAAHNPFNAGATTPRSAGKVTPTPAPAAPKLAPPGGKGAGPQAPSPQGEDGFDMQKAWDRTGLSKDRWKTKLPMLAAGAAGAYGLYAGAKKGFEVLGREAEPAQYNSGGAIPAYGVNQYGVPDRSTPFM